MLQTELYNRNLDALRLRSPSYADKLLKQKAARVRFNEKEVELDQIVSHIKNDTSNGGMMIVLGWGLGGLPRKALKELGRNYMVVAMEFDLKRFNYILHREDFSDVFKDERLYLILDEKEGYGFLEQFRQYITTGNVWILLHPESNGKRQNYEEIAKNIAEQKHLLDVNVGTMISMGKNFIDAQLENVPATVKSHGVKELKDLYKGWTLLAVSPGPSLKANIDAIRHNRDRVKIVCADTALPFLLQNDVIPDFVCGIDPLSDNYRIFFDRRTHDERLKDVSLIAIQQYTPSVLRDYPGNVFVSQQNGSHIQRWLGQFWDDRGEIACPGGSVSHFAMSICEYLGADRIGIVGQDMSWKDSYYCNNIGEVLDEEGKPLDRTEGGIEVDNMFGEKVFTTPTFISFKIWFDNYIAIRKNIEFINLSTGGLPIEGAPYKDAHEFFKDTVPGKEPAPIEKTCLSWNKTGMMEELSGGIRYFKSIISLYRKILKRHHRIVALIPKKDKKAINKLRNEIEEMKLKVVNPIIEMIVAYRFKIDVYVKSADIRDIDFVTDKWERLEKQIQRGLNYYGEFLDATQELLTQLEKLHKRLTKEA